MAAPVKDTTITGLDELVDLSRISLSPNPTDGLININLKEITGPVTLSLLDGIGRLIHTKTITSFGVNQIYSLQLPGSAGLYLVQISYAKGVITQKVLKY